MKRPRTPFTVVTNEPFQQGPHETDEKRYSDFDAAVSLMFRLYTRLIGAGICKDCRYEIDRDSGAMGLVLIRSSDSPVQKWLGLQRSGQCWNLQYCGVSVSHHDLGQLGLQACTAIAKYENRPLSPLMTSETAPQKRANLRLA